MDKIRYIIVESGNKFSVGRSIVGQNTYTELCTTTDKIYAECIMEALASYEERHGNVT